MVEELTPSNTPPAAEPPALDTLLQFEALTRWKAFGIRHAHLETEDSTLVSRALARAESAVVVYEEEMIRIQNIPRPEESVDLFFENRRFESRSGARLHREEKIAARVALNAELVPAFNELWVGMGMDRKLEIWAQSAMPDELTQLAALDETECRGSQLIWRARGYAARLENDTEGKILRHNLPSEASLIKSFIQSPSFYDRTRLYSANRLGFTRKSTAELDSARFLPQFGNPFINLPAPDPSSFLKNLHQAAAQGSGAEALRAFGTEASRQGSIYDPGGAPEALVDFQNAIAIHFQKQAALLAPVRKLLPERAREQVRQWLENVGALPFCQTYWGDSWQHAQFAEIETAIGHRAELEKAFLGNSNLGRVSIFLGGQLGLLPRGDLPQRCAERLIEHGLTRAGWKLLGKMSDPLTTLTRHFKTDRLLDYLTPDSATIDDLSTPKPDFAFGLPFGPDAMRNKQLRTVQGISGQLINPPGNQKAQRTQSEEAQQTQSEIRILCAAASAAALAGLSADQMAAELFGLSKLAKSATQTRLPKDAQTRHVAEFNASFSNFSAGFFRHLASAPEQARARLERVTDFASHAEAGVFATLDGLGPKQAWAQLGKLEVEWHQMIQQRLRGDRPTTSWVPLTDSWPADPSRGLIFNELTDSDALYDEGKALHHCVSSYADKCQEGWKRILSLTHNGERVGTLELVREEKGWSMGQFKAHCNAPVRDESFLDMAESALKHACTVQAQLDTKILLDLTKKLEVKRYLPPEHPAFAPQVAV